MLLSALLLHCDWHACTAQHSCKACHKAVTPSLATIHLTRQVAHSLVTWVIWTGCS